MPELTSEDVAVKGLRGLHLFHFGASSCSQRVRLALAEKALGWESHIIDLRRGEQFRPSYRAIHPGAVVPALVHDGKVVIESVDILSYLETTFPAPRLAPEPHMSDLLELADQTQTCVRTLTHEFLFADRPPPSPADQKQRLAERKDDAEATRFLVLSAARDNSWRRLVADHAAQMHAALALINARLIDEPWLSGRHFGLCDIAWASTLQRLVALGWPLTPAVAGLFARIQARPSFIEAITAFGPEAEAQPARRQALAALLALL